MGNCQAAEAAEVIIQHPGGKVERLYWPTPAAEVMKTPRTCSTSARSTASSPRKVTKALRARKDDKMRRCEAIKQQHDQLRRGDGAEQGASDKDANANAKQRVEKDRHRGSGGAQPAGGGRGRHWRPSLQSISEAAAGQSSSSISESTAS
ncbi:unnamed protein product [Triticum turgidum subsp. durum]|uniref:Uncharacterized protein n=1 Tax=Triticum turgidum subsp. durum TaxID=4567 RepID=A0A9R0TST9_TRITD|nr:unnamed protein product [Triticum turgidum subsp. durum]